MGGTAFLSSSRELALPGRIERIAVIRAGGNYRVFDLLMRTRFSDGQRSGDGVTSAIRAHSMGTRAEQIKVQRMGLNAADRDGLRSAGYMDCRRNWQSQGDVRPAIGRINFGRRCDRRICRPACVSSAL